MERELLYTLVRIAPTEEELRSLLRDRAYLACKAIRDFVHANYRAEERWRYSDRRDAFDCLLYESEKRLCSLHLRVGTLSILLMLDGAECDAFMQQKDAFSPAAQVFFRSAPIFHGDKWIQAALEDMSFLEDIFALIRLKADMAGMDRIGADTIQHGDDQK